MSSSIFLSYKGLPGADSEEIERVLKAKICFRRMGGSEEIYFAAPVSTPFFQFVYTAGNYDGCTASEGVNLADDTTNTLSVQTEISAKVGDERETRPGFVEASNTTEVTFQPSDKSRGSGVFKASTSSATSGSAFGGSASSASRGSLFGASTSSAPLFGASTSSAPLFGARTPSATSASGLFGARTPSATGGSGLFGASTSSASRGVWLADIEQANDGDRLSAIAGNDQREPEPSPLTSTVTAPRTTQGALYKPCKCPAHQEIYDDWPMQDAELTIAKCMKICMYCGREFGFAYDLRRHINRTKVHVERNLRAVVEGSGKQTVTPRWVQRDGTETNLSQD